MNIPDSASVAAYDVAKRVYTGALDRESGLTSLTIAHSMNRNSAADYLGIFACMLEGRRYTRTSNAFATDYFLSQIHADFGSDGLRNALAAVDLHAGYYERLRKLTLNKIRSIQAKHAALLDQSTLNVFPDEVPTPGALFEGGKTTVTVNVYERNPVARRAIDDQGTVRR